MRALILSAGRGSRMGDNTKNKPKCLTLLGGKPLIEWQLNALRKAGINEIGVVSGYKNDSLKKYNLKEFYNKHWANTQMVSSLECADEWLKQGDTIISYSDIFYEYSAISLLLESKTDISILYDPNWLLIWSLRFKDPLTDAESFLINDQNELIEIGEKVNDYSKIKGQYMGLIYFSKLGWKNFSKERSFLSNTKKKKEDMTTALRRLIKNKYKIYCIEYKGKWGEIDTLDDLQVYENNFSNLVPD